MAHRALGYLPDIAVTLICVHLFGTDLPAVVIIFGVRLRYSIQTGREGVGTQFALGMLITLVQGPGRSRTCPRMDRLFVILIGSAMLYRLIWIDAKEPSESFARQVISLSLKTIMFASIVYWKDATYASTFA